MALDQSILCRPTPPRGQRKAITPNRSVRPAYLFGSELASEVKYDKMHADDTHCDRKGNTTWEEARPHTTKGKIFGVNVAVNFTPPSDVLVCVVV